MHDRVKGAIESFLRNRPIVAPTWAIEPQDTAILWRQQVVLHCQADGFPDPTITWMKARGTDGTDYVALGVGMNGYPSFPGLSPQYPDFSSAGGYQHYKPGLSQFPNQDSMHLMPNGSLIIRTASPEHEGFYSCKATNGIGAGLTKVIFLQVNVPAHFYEPVTNISAAAGDPAVLTCQAEGDHPLRVAFTSTPRNAHVPLSSSNVGTPVESSGMHGSGPSKAILQLSVVTRDDAGLYYCSASNTYGEDSMVIHLQVKEPPQSPGRPEVLEVGSRWANIEWTPSTSSLYPMVTPPAYSPNSPMVQSPASTPPVLHYILQYRMNDEVSWNNLTVSNMVGADRGGISGRDLMQKAKISSLRPASRYRLRVIAVNEVGLGPPSTETTLVTTQEAPSGPPTEVVAEATGAESIVVRWKPLLPTYSNGEILGYQIAYREVQQPSRSMSSMGSSMGSNKDSASKSPAGRVKVRKIRGQGRTEMVITGLRPYSHYEISVRAFNGIGPGPPSSPNIAVTFEGVPGSPPSNLRCSPLSSQSLWVRWDPLSPRDRHGLLEGYKVLYQRTVSSDNDAQLKESASHGRYYGSVDTGNDVEVKRTTNLETNLHGLSRFTNYTVHILAFTSMGDGIRSPPVYCATEEDIPGPPEHIKAIALSLDAVLLAWSPPASRNGIIVRYNVYYHPINGGSTFSLHHQASSSSTGGVEGIPKDVTKEVVFISGNDLHTFTYEARRLKEFQRYEFWVTAVTGVGEGPSSSSTIIAPTSRVPARIPAFPLKVKVRHGQSIRLDCPIMGVPSPTRKWRRLAGQNKLNGVHVAGDSILQVTGPTLTLTATSTGIEGNYSCQTENPFGTDSIWWEVDVMVAPSPPRLTLRKADAETIRIQWRLGDSGGSPVTGFILNYKREFGEWEEKVELEPDTREYTIKGLKCGSTYHLRLAVKNIVGTSQFSATLSVTTKGSAPQVPKQEDFLQTNSTSVTMNLDAWPTGGCPLLYLVAEYKALSLDRRKESGSWKLISNNIQPLRGDSNPKEKSGTYWEQSGVLGSDWGLWGGDVVVEEEDEAVYVVPELLPATWYALRVSAHTDAGSIRHEFLFATRNLAGEVIKLPPDNAAHDRTGKNSDPRGLGGSGGNSYGGSGYPSVAFYADPGVVVPILSGIICAIAAGICIALAVRRKRYYHGYKQGEQVNERDPSGTKTLAELENQRNNEQRVIGYCQERDPGDQSIATHQLYSPSPGRKGESSLSGQKSSDSASGQDYEICPYATFSLPGGGSSGREVKGQMGPGTGAMDYSMKFHTFGNQECYAGQPPSPSMVSSESKSDKKLNCPRARRKSNVGPQGLSHSGEACSGTSKSPPDGLNLGECGFFQESFIMIV
ncbi:cell adhesion molecule Dscam2-like [Hetaerina americana]|uniref:cell adhesion molecule Dscam2-like n=1 Tax=Hetaerina americana TaxID=62018 RepID=UPI003A7F2B92